LNDKANFSRYGKSFQEGLSQIIYEDRPFADQITEVLDINFLELEYLRVFVDKIIQYRERYGTHPSVEAVETILRTELDGETAVVREQVLEYFEKISSHELVDIKYIKEQSLDFCRKQNLKEAMMKSVGLLKTCSFDEISKTINDSLKLGSENNFGYDYLADVHYTLELGDTIIATRYDSCLTGYPLSDIINFKDEVYEEIKDIEGKLIVKEYPTKSASTNTIKSHLNKLIKRGIKPGLIIVDYADLLKPVVVRKEKEMNWNLFMRS
jgi:hypothetical protein